MCTRCLSIYSINEACYWDERVVLSEKAPDEIRFWFQNFERPNGFQLPLWSMSFLTDTSEFAWGWYMVILRDSIAKDSFAESEIDTGCTYRELKTTLYILHHLQIS